VVLAWAVLGARAAGAAFPGQNGKIAFASERDGNREVYVMDPDGQNQTNLSNNSAFDDEPAFSPDGTKIAFRSTRDGNFELYAMDANGQNQSRLTNNAATDDNPDWGPLQDDPPPTIPPPTITVVAGSQSQSACLGYNTGRITLKVGGADQSSTLSATSSNPRLLPTSNITFSGTGEVRTATIKTRSGRTGTSTVTITLTEGQMSASVAVTVKAGGGGSNTLNGTSGADLLLAQDGNDTLSALGASDVLCGSNGNDRLSGGSEADTFDGGSGTDTATDYNPQEGDSTTNIP
jgi:dipeptidyl aminopeptidase/acylaminoacyl peptidase